MKNIIIGAAPIITNPPHPPPKKERKTKKAKKNTKREKRGLEPTHLESYCCCQLYITQEPINPLTHPKKKQKKKAKNNHKSREERPPLIWRPTAVNSTL